MRVDVADAEAVGLAVDVRVAVGGSAVFVGVRLAVAVDVAVAGTGEDVRLGVAVAAPGELNS